MCVWAGEGKKREELKRRRSVFGVGGVRLMIEGRGQKAIFRGEEEKEKKKEEEEEECVYKSKEGRKERIAREEGEGAKEMGGEGGFRQKCREGGFYNKIEFCSRRLCEENPKRIYRLHRFWSRGEIPRLMCKLSNPIPLWVATKARKIGGGGEEAPFESFFSTAATPRR